MYLDTSILQCPLTGEELHFVEGKELENIFQEIREIGNVAILKGLVNQSETYFYPIIDDIPILLHDYAMNIGKEAAKLNNAIKRENVRVFNYYNEIDFEHINNVERYNDARKWLDFRDVTHSYISQSLLRAKKYLGSQGKYLLDIASGPIGSNEYLELSGNFDTRICIDISLNALRMARENMGSRKGIYICGDIKNIPLKTNICDSVLCQHTLFHIHKDEQRIALEELYRTVKENGKIVIVYSLFYRSIFMNVTLFPIQVYRIIRHLAGKLYARLFKPKSHLYFYTHSLAWFKKWARDDKKIEIFSWRSVNIYFLKLYIHKKLGGAFILKHISTSEEKHPRLWSKIGEYPVIVVTKQAISK